MLEESTIQDGQLYISCLLNASIERVYQAWTNPAHIGEWMGPGAVVCESVEMDLREGGQYRLVMRTEEGQHIAVGEYREIATNRRLAFTWHWEGGSFTDSLVTLVFSAVEGKTRLELTHSALPDESVAEHHGQGWTGSLAKLKQFLADA